MHVKIQPSIFQYVKKQHYTLNLTITYFLIFYMYYNIYNIAFQLNCYFGNIFRDMNLMNKL